MGYLVFGFAPGLFWLYYFYKKDKYEPEPKKAIIKTFFLGIIAAIPVCIAERILSLLILPFKSLSVPLFYLFFCFLIVGPMAFFIF